jgi:hypothetical protein
VIFVVGIEFSVSRIQFFLELRHTTSASNPRIPMGLLVGKPVGMYTRGSEYLFPRVGHGSEYNIFN